MFKKIKSERQIIALSAVMTFSASIIGIVFGIILNSQYILFDGINNLGGIIISIMVLVVSGFMKKKDEDSFPFGKQGISPLLVFIQYASTFSILLIAIINSVKTLSTGGSSVELGYILLYTIISTVIFNGVFMLLKNVAKRNPTILVRAEINQWKIDAITSLSATIVFLVSLILIQSGFIVIVPYMDSFVLLIVSVYLLKEPLVEMIKSLQELVMMNVIDKKIQKHIKQELKKIKDKYEISKDYTRILKTGNLVFIEVDFVVDRDWKYDAIYHQDTIRAEIFQIAQVVKHEKWISVAFTHLERFAL